MIEIRDDGGISEKLRLSFYPKYLKSIDDEEVADMFDVFYKASEKKVTAEFFGPTGEQKKVTIKGNLLTLLTYEPIRPKRCGCKCIFCFIDQLPKGLRKSLYHKDEDYRFSYLYGNYVTLANISEKDIQRIIKYKLTPLYVSVHSTDERIRKFMLGRKSLPPVLNVLDKLAKGGIKFHCQIVLCPNINDGENLEKTIADLAGFYPSVESVAVVPVGLTKHREGLFAIKKVEKKDAEKAFNIVKKFQDLYLSKIKTPFVYISDEFYLVLGKDVPKKGFYKGFPQYENGVGIVRKFIDNAEMFLRRDLSPIKSNIKMAVITGKLAYGVIKPYIDKFSEKLKINLELIPIKNSTFGDSVTVAGLLTATDITKQLKPKNYKVVFVPDVMLRDRENCFLDDLTLEELSLKLNINVISFEPSLSGLYKKIKRWFDKVSSSDK